MPGITLPVIAWLTPDARDALAALAQGSGTPVERLAGSLLTRALHECSPGEVEKPRELAKAAKRYSLPTAPMGRARARSRQG